MSLKEIRWPSFSVSTSTPSQSKRRAQGRVAGEDEEAEQVIPPPEGDALCINIGFARRHLPMNRDPAAALAGDGGVALDARAAFGMRDVAGGDCETKERENFKVAAIV